jgi:hypothetical protein
VCGPRDVAPVTRACQAGCISYAGHCALWVSDAIVSVSEGITVSVGEGITVSVSEGITVSVSEDITVSVGE